MFKSKIVFALAMGFTFLMMSACDDSSSSPTDDSENNLSSVSTPATSSSSEILKLKIRLRAIPMTMISKSLPLAISKNRTILGF